MLSKSIRKIVVTMSCEHWERDRGFLIGLFNKKGTKIIYKYKYIGLYKQIWRSVLEDRILLGSLLEIELDELLESVENTGEWIKRNRGI